MVAKVNICQGNIFEGGADLTVLPASAKEPSVHLVNDGLKYMV